MADTGSEGYVDRWIVYGKINGEQLFTAKELTLEPGTKCTIRDNGAYGLTVVQGSGKMNNLTLDCPKLIRFTELTEDEVFCTEPAAKAGVVFENTSAVEDLVVLRYFGPEANSDAPESGASHKGCNGLSASGDPVVSAGQQVTDRGAGLIFPGRWGHYRRAARR